MLDSAMVSRWNQKKLGLVLSGGGAKGAYEAGVICALHALDLADKIAVVSGTSIGALNTLLFAMDDPSLCLTIWQHLGFHDVLFRAEKADRRGLRELLKAFSSETLELTDRSGLLQYLGANGTSPFKQEGIRKILLRYLDYQRLRACRRDLYVCAYNIDTYRPEYLLLNEMSDDEVIDAALASCAIPYLFPPVTFRGGHYADGGVHNPAYPHNNCDNTPFEPLEGYHLDAVVAVYLSDGAEPRNSMRNGTPVFSLVPSHPLAPVQHAGAINFTQGSLQKNRVLGYRDALSSLAPLIIRQLRPTEQPNGLHGR